MRKRSSLKTLPFYRNMLVPFYNLHRLYPAASAFETPGDLAGSTFHLHAFPHARSYVSDYIHDFLGRCYVRFLFSTVPARIKQGEPHYYRLLFY